jgi:diacylglycerol kinase (ATP)
VIFNPTAGSGVPRTRLEALLRHHLPAAELVATESVGAARRLARDAVAAGVRRVVAAGGDGLCNEVLNGIALPPEDVAVGLLPLGTGNDLARTLGIPRQTESAAAVLAAGSTRTIDLVRATRDGEAGSAHYFANVALAGFGADLHLTSSHKRRWRSLAYLRAAVGTLPTLRARSFELQPEGEATGIVRSAYLVAVANGCFMGGGIPIAPDAELDDGWLDVVVVPVMSSPALAATIPRVLAGRHTRTGRVEVYRWKDVRLTGEADGCLNLDGEIVEWSDARFEVLPRSLTVIAPVHRTPG